MNPVTDRTSFGPYPQTICLLDESLLLSTTTLQSEYRTPGVSDLPDTRPTETTVSVTRLVSDPTSVLSLHLHLSDRRYSALTQG